MKKTKSEYIKVKNSSIHSNGVFATKDIPKNTKIIEYVGEKITKAESERRADMQLNKHKKNSEKNGSVYIFSVNKKHDIDGNVSWNTAKYINHSCKPNCEAINDRGKIWIVAIKNIKKDDELSYDYGYDIDDFEEHPCHCKSEKCVGFIVAQEHRPKLKKILLANGHRKKVKA